MVGITLYQEHKTENALAALRDLSRPRALVIRDGQQHRVAGRDVVRGDVVLLIEGDRVPADAMLLDGVNLSVDESLLTGESVPVRKPRRMSTPRPGRIGAPGGDGTPWVFSGTLVVKGHGIADVAGDRRGHGDRSDRHRAARRSNRAARRCSASWAVSSASSPSAASPRPSLVVVCTG